MPPKSSAKIGWAVPKRSLVTGGSGFVGHRLVEMLVERGAEYVCSFDVAHPHFQRIMNKSSMLKVI